MHIRSAFLIALHWWCIVPVAAQDIPREAVVAPITKAGVTAGCSVQYTVVDRDQIYKAGAPIGISGSLAWMLHPNLGIVLSFKLIAADIDPKALNSLLPIPVAHGFLRLNRKVYQVEDRYACDQKTGFCGAMGFNSAIDAYEAFAQGGETIAFGFNRSKDGMDVSVAVPTLSPDQSNQLNLCMLQLLERAAPKNR